MNTARPEQMSAPRPGQRSGRPRLAMRPGKPADLLLRRAWLLDPRAGIDSPHDLLIRGGHVEEIAAPGTVEPMSGVELVEAEGLHVFPGFVDPHVHLRTPGREDEEDLESGTRAAAAGGFCCVLAMPNTDPVVDSAPVLRSLHERAGAEARVPVGLLAAATKGQAGEELTEMAELAAEGAAGFTDDGRPLADARLVRQALQYQRLSGGVLALHEEDPSLSGSGVMHEGPVSTLLGLTGIPSISESTMITRDAAIARYEGGRMHVLHLSAAESVAAVERARDEGVKLTAEVTPHHLTLTEDAVRSLDPRFKMNPPLRSESDRAALIEGLRSGTIDCIATDHAPHAREEKEAPFEQAPMGVTGLETAFSGLYTELVLPGVLPLALVVDRLTAGAAVYGLSVPSLATRSSANLCLVDLESRWVVGESGYESRSENSCFAGRTLQGRVLMTVASGTVAFRERSFAIRLAAGDASGAERLAGSRGTQ
jgi:dihydroorotase